MAIRIALPAWAGVGPDGYFAVQDDADWADATILPMPRGEVARAVGVLTEAWKACPVCVMACAAGLRAQDVGAATVAELMELLGSRARLREWFRP
eukprot:8198369-Alexandrium_andersonii.AAC.1